MRKTLPRRTNYFYQQFVNAANKNIPHWKDMERYYHFIWVAHLGRTKLNVAELEQMLLADGFPADVAESLSRVYYDGRELLKNRIIPAYFNWKGKDRECSA